jgi:hypothetical protein
VPAVETTNIEAEQTMQSHHSYDNLKLCGRDFNALDSRMLGQHAGLDVLAAGAAADSPLSIVVEAAFESKRADMLELLQVLNPTARECNSDNPMSAINQSISSSMVCSAAQHGQLDCLRFLTAAAAVGTVSTRHHIPERDRCAVSSSAAAGGDVPTLQWLQQQGFLQEAAAPQPGLCCCCAWQGCSCLVTPAKV